MREQQLQQATLPYTGEIRLTALSNEQDGNQGVVAYRVTKTNFTTGSAHVVNAFMDFGKALQCYLEEAEALIGWTKQEGQDDMLDSEGGEQAYIEHVNAFLDSL